jgi:hypothetical protein
MSKKSWFYIVTSALAGGVWSTSRPGRFTPWERAPGTHWIGVWMDRRHGEETILDPHLIRTPTLLSSSP